MRFGCCLNMVAGTEDGIGAEHIAALKQIGFDYAELPLAEMTALPDRAFDAIKANLTKNAIRCETCNNFFPKTVRLTGRQPDYKAIMSYVRRALDRAGALGVEYVVFGSGGAKNVPEGFPIEEGYLQVVKLLKDIAPIAHRNNIAIVIEPLRKAECNLINTFQEGCRLARDVNEENIKVLVDYYHLSAEGEPVEHIQEEGPEFLRHVHFARHEGRAYPQNIEEDAYLPFIRALKDIRYQGRVSCEAYTDDFIKSAERTLKFFKEYFL